MLQWMGGSRRKVATSRKSTQKRQKQYFEQRKRQQQRTDGLESSADHKEHRSLDVLSLLNVSTSSQEQDCPNGRQDLQFSAPIMKYHITKGLLQNLTNNATPADYVEVKEAGTQLGYQMETLCPENNSYNAPDCHNNASSSGNYKTDLWNASPEQQRSVFDLLADDGPNGNLEGSPIHEAHVAFSVEGLGKVGTQTPAHSPQSERIFQSRCSSPRRAARRLNSKNFDYMLDDLELEKDVMMQDVSVPLGANYLEFSREITNSYSNQKQKYLVADDCTTFDGQGSKIKSSFNDSKIFYNIGNNNDDLWDVGSSVLNHDFLSEKKHNISGKMVPYQMERIDFMKYGNQRMSNYVSEGPRLQKNRDSVKATDTYNILESPFQEHQLSENNDDFLTSKRTGYPAVGSNFDLKELIGQPDCYYSENARDNLSLLSEESCSSSAVRGGEVTNRSPPNSTREYRRRHKNAFGSHVDIYGLKNFYAKKSQPHNRVDIQEESCIRGSGKCKRMPMPIPSKSKQFHHFNSPFQDFGQEGSWWFDQGSSSVDTSSGFASFCQTSDKKVPASRSKPEMGDPLSGFSVHESHIDAKLPFDGSRYGESVECLPFGNFLSENLTFCKPFNNVNCDDSPPCSKVEFGSTKPNLSLDSESGGNQPESFDVAGSHREKLFPDLLAQENVSKHENKSNSWPANCEKFEPGKQSSSWDNYMLSEKNKAMDALSSKDKVHERREAEDGTLELKESVETADSLEHLEETSSSVKISDRLESSADHKEYKHNTEIHLPCQIESEGIGDSGPEQRKIVSKKQGNGINSSSSVMMLESYVVQLLCVQKLQTDVPEKDTMKEV